MDWVIRDDLKNKSVFVGEKRRGGHVQILLEVRQNDYGRRMTQAKEYLTRRQESDTKIGILPMNILEPLVGDTSFDRMFLASAAFFMGVACLSKGLQVQKWAQCSKKRTYAKEMNLAIILMAFEEII